MVVSCAPDLTDGRAHVHTTLLRVRHMRTCQGKADRVKMMEAQVNTFLSADGHSQLTQQQITAIDIGLIKRPTEIKAVQHLCPDPLTQQPIERFMGKEQQCQG
jgi:hypothetical protein